MLVLLFGALWFILRGDLLLSYFVPFCSCVFQSFKHCDYLAWGRENLSAFRTFDRFVLVWICRFPPSFSDYVKEHTRTKHVFLMCSCIGIKCEVLF